MADKYLYEVHPLRPVLTPIEGRFTRRPFSAEFTVEEVKELMTNARVYRRFPDITEIIPVTGENLSDLHRPRFDAAEAKVTKDDVKQEVKPAVAEKPIIKEESKVEPTPEPVKVDEAKEEASAEQVSTSEEKVEETVAEETVEEEIQTAEEAPVEEVEKEEIEADFEEEVAQEPEKEVSESKPNTVYVPQNNKFHNNKKKH